MSLYAAVRFKGIVKKELRDIFEPIALHGKWSESPDQVLSDFGEGCWSQSGIPCGVIAYIERWNEEPWETSYNKETGEWIFQAEPNTRSFDFLTWEDEIIPYCMESVEHYESWMEPLGDEPYIYTTYLQKFQNGEWIDIGWIDENGNLIKRE